MKVLVEPNHFKLIEVPVAVVGEVSGRVYDAGSPSKKGVGRIKINIYREGKTLIASATTQEDGYFNYLGLAPGSYTASIDPEQMQRVPITSLTGATPFTIKVSREGDLIDDLEFYIKKQ
jgi:hypothetical protein